jgi:hypothetical protein
MTATTQTRITTEPAHLIAHAINRAGRVKAFVQGNGNLRVVARTCAAARIEISRASRVMGVDADSALSVFEVRFKGTTNVLTYPMVYDSMRTDIDRQTGALLAPAGV